MSNDKDFRVKNGLYVATDASILGNAVVGNGISANGNVNFTNSPNVALGTVGNVVITGGTNGQYLQTNGSGGLAWATVSTQLAGAYVFTQSTPATTWVVAHNLGVQYVNVQVIDSTGNSYTGRYNYPTITFNNAAALTITFDSAVAGYAAVTSGGGQQNVGGSNTQIQFNDANVLGGSAALTFNKSSNLVSMGGALSVTGNANVGNLGTAQVLATANVTAPQLISNVATGTAPLVVTSTTQVANLNAATAGSATTATSATTAGTVTTAAQPNITSLGTLTSLAVTGNVTAGNLVGILANGNSNISIPAANGNINISAGGTPNELVITSTGVNVAGTLNATGNANVGNIGATQGVFTNVSGNGSALSSITGSNVTGQVGNALVSGTVYTAAQPNITSVGTLTSLAVTGNVTAGNLIGPHANGNSNINIPTANGNVNISVGGTANVLVTTTTGVNVAGTLNATGNLSAGNISATLLAGTLSTAAQPNITSVGTLTSLSVTGNISAGNVSATTFTGTLSGAATTAGTVTTAAQPNITSVGTLTSLTVTGNATAGNLSTGGTLSVTGNANVGNLGTAGLITATGNVTGGNLVTGGVLNVTGTGQSSIAGNLAMNSKNVTGLAEPVNAQDAATKNYVDSVAQGLNVHDAVQAATPNTLAVITGGTITYNNGSSGVGATLTTTGTFNLIDGVNVQTVGTRILVKNEANAVFNGIYTYTNTTAITRALDYNTVPEVEAGDFVFCTGGTLYDNTGWVQTDSPTAIGGATDTINFTQFSGAGTYQAGTGLTLTGSTFSISNTAVTAASYGNGDRVASFTVNSQGQLTAASNVAIAANAANLTGTTLASGITTSSLTTVGTLGSLTVTGNASAGNLNTAGAVVASTLTSNVATGTAPLTVTSTTRVANLNVAYANVADFTVIATQSTGNYYLQFANAITGNISQVGNATFVANLANGSITATTFVGALSGAATSATTAGTVTTAAQPNITSTGTLTGLTIGNATANAVFGNGTITLNSGLITGNGAGLSQLAGANVTGTVGFANVAAYTGVTTLTTGIYYPTFVSAVTGNLAEGANSVYSANIANGSFAATTFVGALSGAATSATTAGTVTTAAQPNITSVGTLSSLAVTANATANNFVASTFNLNTSNSVTIANGTAVTYASQQGGRTFVAYDMNTYPSLYESRFVNLGTSTNVPTNAGSGMGYWFGMGAGDVANRGFDILGTSSNTIFFRDHSLGNSAWVQLVSNVSGTAVSATTAGTVTTAAQPNITSVGTLTSLGVNGTITAVNITANTGVFTGNANGLSSLQAGNLTGTVAQARLANSTLTLGNTTLTLGATTTTVAGLTNVTSTQFTSNVATGTAPFVVTSTTQVANLSVATAGSATTAGTVTTAAQPNITSVGTLTSLTSSGNISGANVISTNNHVFSVATGISAAGTAQGNATAITKDFNVVSTVASGAGVVLPTAVAGYRITVINTSANALLVYPAVNGIINSAAANAAYSQPAGARLDYISTTTTQWYTLNATYG